VGVGVDGTTTGEAEVDEGAEAVGTTIDEGALVEVDTDVLGAHDSWPLCIKFVFICIVCPRVYKRQVGGYLSVAAETSLV